MFVCVSFRQEPECVNQWWCGWGQSPVQTSRWLSWYAHHPMFCKSLYMHVCHYSFEFDESLRRKMCCVGFVQMMKVTLMQRRNRRKRWVPAAQVVEFERLSFALDTQTCFGAQRLSIDCCVRRASWGILGNISLEWRGDCNLTPFGTCMLSSTPSSLLLLGKLMFFPPRLLCYLCLQTLCLCGYNDQ